MKRYYYDVQGYGPDFEHELGSTQYNNDQAFIGQIIVKYILSPNHPHYDKDKEHRNLIGHLNFQFSNWEGDEIDWLNNTLTLFKNEMERLKDETKYVEYINFDELKMAITWLEDQREQFIEKEPGDSLEKIKWNGGPASIGFFFRELVDKNWIEIPLKKDQTPNYRKLALWCYNTFDIDTKSFESLYNEFTGKPGLTTGGQTFFQIKKRLSP